MPIKNGLGPVLLQLVESGWATHLATNGAGVIHDWEFAFQGKSCEHVGPMVAEGRFGNWQETGFFINLALNVGAYLGLGYGESIGAMIENEGVRISSISQLQSEVTSRLAGDPQHSAAAADLLTIIQRFDLAEGWMEIPHPWKRFSVQSGAYRNEVPSDRPPNDWSRHHLQSPHEPRRQSGGERQNEIFLTFAESVSRLDGGVYISIGSAVMSPMVFEKSLSISQKPRHPAGPVDRQSLHLCQRYFRVDVGLDEGRAARG